MNADGFNSVEPFSIYPVGHVKSELKEITFRPDVDVDPEIRKVQIVKYREQIKQVISELHIYPAFEALLDGIEAFSHIMVLFWPHLLQTDRRHFKKVHPMGRKDIPQQGIFATRSPARPNPILVSSISLIERKQNILLVKGLEALDQSPIIDIKPVLRDNDGIEKPIVPDWIRQLHDDLE